jgi:hypothetical protein
MLNLLDGSFMKEHGINKSFAVAGYFRKITLQFFPISSFLFNTLIDAIEKIIVKG